MPLLTCAYGRESEQPFDFDSEADIHLPDSFHADSPVLQTNILLNNVRDIVLHSCEKTMSPKEGMTEDDGEGEILARVRLETNEGFDPMCLRKALQSINYSADLKGLGCAAFNPIVDEKSITFDFSCDPDFVHD